jgi:antitoxin MazE
MELSAPLRAFVRTSSEQVQPMKVRLVRIGRSRALRLPKRIIEKCGFGDTVDLRVVDGCVIIAPVRRPREGWEDAFRAAGSSDTDELLMDGIGDNRFDREEWEW